MKIGLPNMSLFVLIGLVAACCAAACRADDEDGPVSSRIEKADNGDVFLVQQLTIKASVDKVWRAYTTSEGWQKWVAPVADVDFKIGGTIRTNYRKEGTVTDADANTLHIINYVPRRLLTLQAELSKNWPDFLKEHEKEMFNVVTFEPLGKDKTRLTSYGIGYKDTPQHQQLLKFFIPANERSYRKLIEYVESAGE